jgi:hypothetical protein
MIEERITRNHRRIFFERIAGKLKRISFYDIRDRIKRGEPMAIKLDIAGRAAYGTEYGW